MQHPAAPAAATTSRPRRGSDACPECGRSAHPDGTHITRVWRYNTWALAVIAAVPTLLIIALLGLGAVFDD